MDLFQVVSSSEWGVVFAIRTGPGGGQPDAGHEPTEGWGMSAGLEGGGRAGAVHRPQPRGLRPYAGIQVRAPGRAGRDRGDYDSHVGGEGLLPGAGRALLAAAPTDGGVPSRTSAAEVEQEPLALRLGAFSVYRAQINQFLSPTLPKKIGMLDIFSDYSIIF